MRQRFGKVWPYVTAFVVLVLLTFAYILYYLPVNKEKYFRLISKSNPVSSGVHTVKQIRYQTQKDIFFLKNNERMQLRVKAENAELKFVTSSNKTEVIEQMQDVICFMQEELFYLLPDGREAVLQPNGKLLLRDANPKKDASWITLNNNFEPMQTVRYMEADSAIYHYQNDRLDADTVNLARFAMPGHKLSDSIDGLVPIMSGIAQSVVIAKEGKEYTFKAQKLKMSVDR